MHDKNVGKGRRGSKEAEKIFLKEEREQKKTPYKFYKPEIFEIHDKNVA